MVPLDRALTNARVLVRRCVQLARSGRRLPSEYAALVEQLADAVAEIEAELRIARTPIVARGSLVAVAEATARVPRSADLSVEVILAQVRSIVVDLLQAIGLDQDAALDALPRLADDSGEATARPAN